MILAISAVMTRPALAICPNPIPDNPSPDVVVSCLREIQSLKEKRIFVVRNTWQAARNFDLDWVGLGRQAICTITDTQGARRSTATGPETPCRLSEQEGNWVLQNGSRMACTVICLELFLAKPSQVTGVRETLEDDTQDPITLPP
jgi:hypothetical protein